MIAEDRAAIVAWQLLGRQASIEWFRSELERQRRPPGIAQLLPSPAPSAMRRQRPGRWQPRPSSGAGRTKARPSSWPRGPRRPGPWATSPASVKGGKELPGPALAGSRG